MAVTIPYAPTTWVAGVTALSAAVGNNFESQYAAALSSFNPDLFTAFVYSGLVATKDGTIATQLNVTAGKAYLTQTDGMLGVRSLSAFTKTTTTPSTTYFLDLNPDGTVSWGTSHSAVANHLTLASVTTDGASNILAVTDARPLSSTLLSGMAGGLTFNQTLTVPAVMGLPSSGAPGFGDLYLSASTLAGANRSVYLQSFNGSAYTAVLGIGSGSVGVAKAAVDDSGTLTAHEYKLTAGGFVEWVGTPSFLQRYWTPASGSANGQVFFVWNGSSSPQVLGIGSAAFANGSPATALADGGGVLKLGGQATAGSFGVPVIVAQAVDINVTATTQQTILSYTPTVTGLYRVSGHASVNNPTTPQNILFGANYTDPHLGSPTGYLGVSYGVASPILLTGTNSVAVNSVSFPCTSISLWAKAGNAITINYRDPGGTPNDFVTALIERLS